MWSSPIISDFFFVHIVSIFILFLWIGLWYRKCEPEKEIWGWSEEGNKEASEVQRSDQDMDPIKRDKG